MERSASLKKGKMTTAQMTVTALMTAVLCIFGPLALPIPVSPVPISLTNLVLYFMVYILGMKGSLMSFGLYLLLGATGLPVFSGFAGGLGKLAGPTGGYLLGFIFMTLAAGFMVERFPDRCPPRDRNGRGYSHMLPVWDRVAGGADVAYIYSGPWSRRDPVSSRRRGKDPPGSDPRPEAQKGRKAHVIQMTVIEYKT